MTVVSQWNQFSLWRHTALHSPLLSPHTRVVARSRCPRLPKRQRLALNAAADVVKTEESEAFTTSDGVVESVEDKEAQVRHAHTEHLEAPDRSG